MPNYVLTGAPGAGKTAILRQLERDGYRVVEEAATDVIAVQQALGHPQPWTCPGFAGRVLGLQRQRQRVASGNDGDVAFFDRSPVCTLALCRHLGHPEPGPLLAEIARVLRTGFYARTVFFVRSLGFVTPTAARQISLADAAAFEALHERTYLEFGFRLVDVPPGPLADRAGVVRRAVAEAAEGP